MEQGCLWWFEYSKVIAFEELEDIDATAGRGGSTSEV